MKRAVRPSFYRLVHRSKAVYECPICDYRGPFKDKRVTNRPATVRCDSKCPGCTGTERHRMLSLMIEEMFASWNPSTKRILHFAPEPCLQPRLQKLFASYSTADLFMPGVDFKEDIQKMSFADASFDCVIISHVMTSVPDMEASVGELRRILAPGGIAIIAEAFACEATHEYGEQRGDFWREVGLNAFELFGKHFSQVEPFLSDRYDQKFQLNNRIQVNGRPDDDYPKRLRVDNVGYKTIAAVCHV
ncbi:MAG: class I SAM-dependent methyltransferase [Planctomycetes bacterium]|nr:class I SAM-dependent methyltransferase [Planctomycetota bacterium]